MAAGVGGRGWGPFNMYQKSPLMRNRRPWGPLGGNEIWVASLLHGQATASAEEAAVLIEALALDPEVAQTLTA